MMKYYAGIGARSTPDYVLELMTRLASVLEHEGWVLRSGHALGADSAFEAGVRGSNKQIFVANDILDNVYKNAETAQKFVSRFHPNPKALSRYARALMARNTYQILGADLKTPSTFVVCWTQDGAEIGGTAQAIRIAKSLDIPVFNMGHLPTFEFFRSKLSLGGTFGFLDLLISDKPSFCLENILRQSSEQRPHLGALDNF